MRFDAQNLFSDAQAITATAASTNIIDGEVARDLGPGQPMPLAIQVVEDFATLTSLTVTLQGDDNASFSSPSTLWTSPAVPAANLVAGYKFGIEYWPSGTKERYYRLNYTVAGSNATAGKITAGITDGVQSNK